MANGERRMFGFDLHWWEHAMLLSLGFAALAAVAVVVATSAVVMLTREENRDKSEELLKYQSDAESRTAEAARAAATANERAAGLEKDVATARLETERLKALLSWREVSIQDRKVLVASLAIAPSHVFIVCVGNDIEAQGYAKHLADAFTDAGWIVGTQSIAYRESIFGVRVVGPPNSKETGAVAESFTKAGIAFNQGPWPDGGTAMPMETPPEFKIKVGLVVGSKPLAK